MDDLTSFDKILKDYEIKSLKRQAFKNGITLYKLNQEFPKILTIVKKYIHKDQLDLKLFNDYVNKIMSKIFESSLKGYYSEIMIKSLFENEDKIKFEPNDIIIALLSPPLSRSPKKGLLEINKNYDIFNQKSLLTVNEVFAYSIQDIVSKYYFGSYRKKDYQIKLNRAKTIYEMYRDEFVELSAKNLKIIKDKTVDTDIKMYNLIQYKRNIFFMSVFNDHKNLKKCFDPKVFRKNSHNQIEDIFEEALIVTAKEKILKILNPNLKEIFMSDPRFLLKTILNIKNYIPIVSLVKNNILSIKLI